VSARGKIGRVASRIDGRKRLLVFTDLDGMLLAPNTHDWQVVARTLAELRRQNIPLTLCTSKTRAEVVALRRTIGHHGPYIAENGGILVLPWELLGAQIMRGLKPREFVVRLGWSYPEILRALTNLSRLAKVEVRAFHEMAAEEIACTTGRTLADARRSRRREASECFQFIDADPARIQYFRRIARACGMQVAEGESFWHLTAGTDNAQAMGLLSCLYEFVEGVRVRTIALGDAGSDLTMLEQADLPILVSKSAAKDARLSQALPDVMRVQGAGPRAWARAVRIAVLQGKRDLATDIRMTRQSGLADGKRAPERLAVSPSLPQGARWQPRAGRRTAASR
jgi:mannosyl-3-phosphoglycerate phosphatase